MVKVGVEARGVRRGPRRRCVGYWREYDAKFRAFDKRALFEYVAGKAEELGPPFSRVTGRRGRDFALTPCQYAAMFVVAVFYDMAERDVEQEAPSLTGKHIDHSTFGKIIDRIPERYLLQLLGAVRTDLGKHLAGERSVYLCDSTMVSWETFVEDNLMTLKSQRIYLATCYSQNAADILAKKYGNGKAAIGFEGLVDVDEAAYVVSSVITFSRGDSGKAMGMLRELSNVMIGKIQTPERYNHWLLYSQWVRGIYHTTYGTPYWATTYKYTHPDWWDYDLGVESVWNENPGYNLAATHILKSQIDTMNLASVIYNAAAGLVGAAAVLTAGAALIAAGVLALAGLFEYAFFEVFLKDELGSGWMWVQNGFEFWAGLYLYKVLDFKLGAFIWVRFMWPFLFGFIPMTPILLPLFYGGLDLGIDGV